MSQTLKGAPEGVFNSDLLELESSHLIAQLTDLVQSSQARCLKISLLLLMQEILMQWLPLSVTHLVATPKHPMVSSLTLQ